MGSAFEAKFIKKIKIAKDTYSFYFEKGSIIFNPGEYIRMTLEISRPDLRGSSRYFTIAASPLDPYLIITTKIIKSSFKKKLLNLRFGERVKIFGPMGNFVIDKKNKRSHVFLAGGIGLTTFYSMIKHADQVNDNRKTYLLASFSTPEEIIYKTEFEEISERNKNFQFIYTITSKSKNWKGEVGRIDSEKIKKFVKDYKKSIFYIVGSPTMVEELKSQVLKLKVLEDNIKLEDFSGY